MGGELWLKGPKGGQNKKGREEEAKLFTAYDTQQFISFPPLQWPISSSALPGQNDNQRHCTGEEVEAPRGDGPGEGSQEASSPEKPQRVLAWEPTQLDCARVTWLCTVHWLL